MPDLGLENLPPWAVPAAILHAAMFVVLILPLWRAFRHAGVGGGVSLVLVLPGLGLLIAAILMATSVLPRAGWPRLLAVLVLIPAVNLFVVWPCAYAKWTRAPRKELPSEERRPEKTPEPPQPGEVARAEPTLAADPAPGTPPAPAAQAPASPEPAGQPEPSVAAAPAAESPVAENSPGTRFQTLDPNEPALFEELNEPPEVDQTMVAGPAPRPSEPPDAPGDAAARRDSERRTVRRAQPSQSTVAAAESEAAAKADDPGAQRGEAASADDDMSLAADVLEAIDDADAAPPPEATTSEDAPADAEPQQTEPAAPETPPDPSVDIRPAGPAPIATPREYSTAVPAGKRIWSIRGANARAANIDVTVREEDLSRSSTGILVGRSNRVDFIIGDESVSRNHARFVYFDGDLCVEDLDSMNGTWVDGQKLQTNLPVRLTDRCEVEFGKIRLLVTEADRN